MKHLAIIAMLLALAGCGATTFEKAPLPELACDTDLVGRWLSVAGRGEVDVAISVDGLSANTVKISINNGIVAARRSHQLGPSPPKMSVELLANTGRCTESRVAAIFLLLKACIRDARRRSEMSYGRSCAASDSRAVTRSPKRSCAS